MTDEQRPTPEEQHATGSSSLGEQISRYSELALVLPAGAVGGWLLGAWADKHFGTHWIYLLGLVLGFIGGFVRIIRVATRVSK